MQMKYAAINRDTNEVIDLFDSAHEANAVVAKCIAEDRANHVTRLKGYGVKMMILDDKDKVVIDGLN